MTSSDKPAKAPPREALQAPAWHALTIDEACARQGVDVRLGLSAGEAEGRQARSGPNRLAEKPPRSAWLRLSDQFKSTLILILIAAAALAYVVGDLKDAVVILIVVVLNALLGFYQENRAEQSLAALKKMLGIGNSNALFCSPGPPARLSITH